MVQLYRQAACECWSIDNTHCGCSAFSAPCVCLCVQLWDVEAGKERATLSGHTAEIVSVCFNTPGDLLATGSFDHESRLWDVRSGQCVHVLSGHRGEVSSTVFNHAGMADLLLHSCQLSDSVALGSMLIALECLLVALPSWCGH